MRSQDDCISVILGEAGNRCDLEDPPTIEPLSMAHLNTSAGRSKEMRSTGRLSLALQHADGVKRLKFPCIYITASTRTISWSDVYEGYTCTSG